MKEILYLRKKSKCYRANTVAGGAGQDSET